MINWLRVSQLQDEVGAEDFDEVVDLFLEEVEVVTTRLRTLTNRENLGADLHFLKGSALSLGFEAFSKHCNDGEIAADTGVGETVDIEALLTCYAQSKEIFLAEYDKRLAA